MIQQMRLTVRDISKVNKKLDGLHEKFSVRGEKEVIYDFAKMLKKRMSRVKTAQEFVTAYYKAIADIMDENKVPEVWDKTTEGFMHKAMSYVAECLFSRDFAEDVRAISYTVFAH